MNSFAFLISAISFIGLSLFVYANYPKSWHHNRMFNASLILWHIRGSICLIIIFTTYKHITHEGLRHEITRIGTYYYVLVILLAFMYAIRLIASRSYLYISKADGTKLGNTRKKLISDKRLHAIFFLFLAYTICTIGYFNIDILHLKTYDIHSDKTAQEKELNICLVSDIHAGSGTWEYTYDDLAELIDECESDVLFLAGDIFDETTSQSDLENVAWVIETIKKPRYGIYYIYGNHDDYREDWAAAQMKKLGVRVLKDEMVTIGQDIQLIGRLDPKIKGSNPDELFSNLKPDLNKPLIVLQHRPQEFKKLSEYNVDLVTVGHTHGFNIPYYLFAPLFMDTYYGEKVYGNTTTITSSGVSAWGFHYKFPAESEVVKIHLYFE